MKRPWMPLYIGDFSADTAHLSTEEVGAYIFLIMHYWVHEGLPQSQLTRSRVARLSLKRWKAMEPAIQSMFGADWSHKRIDQEIDKSKKISIHRALSGSMGGRSRLVQ